MWRSTIHVLVKQAMVLTGISTPVKRKIKTLDLLQCQYPQYLSPLPGKRKVWLSKRQGHICHIYNHSFTMEQCIKLSELNLQQLTEFVPEPFAKLCYLKLEFPQLNTSEFFLTYIFWEQLPDLWFPLHIVQLFAWVCMFESSSMFERMRQHTSELTGRKPLTLDARIYIAAPKI